MLRRTTQEGHLVKTTVGPLTESDGAVTEGNLSHADFGYDGNRKIKFSALDANEKILPEAVKVLKKYMVGIGIKPAMAKKLAEHNRSNIDSALTRIRYESL
jgi:hypothetical protein